MKADHEELMELIDLWNYSEPTKAKVRRLLLSEKPPPPHLFRYYGKEKGKVQQAEELFARTLGAKHALAVNSGTSALMAALAACEVGPGDEVLVPAYTFFASASVIVASKAIPVICEVNDSLNIDPADMQRKITPQTKAVIVVHMRGLCADMDEVTAVAGKHGLKVIEDAAQACGGSYKGRMLGALGDCGCFSFDAYKIAMSGEGGFVVTDDDYLYVRAQSWHDTAACWRPDRYARERMPGELFCGENYRMSELQGAVALAQIRKLTGHIEKMRAAKNAVRRRLDLPDGFALRRQPDPEGDTGIVLIVIAPSAETAKALIAALKENGLPAGGRYDATVRDWHIYSNWEHILERKTVTKEGCPFTCPYYKGALPPYGRDMCPHSLDLLSRSVHIAVSGDWTDAKCAETARAVNKAAAAVS